MEIIWVMWSHIAILGHTILGNRQSYLGFLKNTNYGEEKRRVSGLNILNNSRPAYRVLLHLLHHLNKSLVRDEMQTLRKASFFWVKIKNTSLDELSINVGQANIRPHWVKWLTGKKLKMWKRKNMKHSWMCGSIPYRGVTSKNLKM